MLFFVHIEALYGESAVMMMNKNLIDLLNLDKINNWPF
tara:strand:+ start:2885 stop:2998 length:114 start_codon:yes stop_codon:yes gene_type:complete